MKNKIIYTKNILGNVNNNILQLLRKKQNTLTFTPKEVCQGSFVQNEKLKKIFNSGKDKMKILNLTNNTYHKNQKDIRKKDLRNKNISMTCTNLNTFMQSNMSKKRDIISKTKTKAKTKYIKKIRENADTSNIHKKNTILNNYQKFKKLNLINDKGFSGKEETIYNSNMFKSVKTTFINMDYQHKNKSHLKSFVKNINKKYKKIPIKIDLHNYYKSHNNLQLNKNNRYKKFYNNVNTEVDLKKNVNTNNNILSKNIAININMNNSSKLTNISSYVASEKHLNSKISPNEETNKYKDINLIKEKILLKFKSDVKEGESQDFESKFLNYELGLSDKVSTLYNNKNILDDNVCYDKNKNNFYDECEKSVEEIEKIANEIYNSEYKNKIISYINHRKTKEINDYINKYFGMNNDIEELKNGEEIQNVLTLNANIKNK